MSGAATATARPAQATRGLVTSFKAPLLDRILGEETPGRRRVVLDLGTPSQHLVDRLSALGPCRVEIASLAGARSLDDLNAADLIEEDAVRAIQAALPPSRERLDLVLLWDLPNYLRLERFALLCRLLARRARPGCRLHMLIAYSRREMPAAPAVYRLAAEGQLTQTCRDAAIMPAPRYSPESLGQAVHGFAYERGILLANGMQEFVYAWPQEPKGGVFRRS